MNKNQLINSELKKITQ